MGGKYGRWACEDDGRASWRIAEVSVRHAASLPEWGCGARRNPPELSEKRRVRKRASSPKAWALRNAGSSERSPHRLCRRLLAAACRSPPVASRQASTSASRLKSRRASSRRRRMTELHASVERGRQGSPQDRDRTHRTHSLDGVGALRVSRRQGFFFNDLENPAQARKSTL